MSKNKNNNFQNYAAKRFAQIEKIDQYAENDIFDILSKELPIILRQITSAKSGAQYPEYAVNMFANISAAKFVYQYVQTWDKQIRKTGDSDLMDITDVKALRDLVSEAFIRRDKFVNQKMEEKDRNKLLLKTYAMLDPVGVKRAKKLKLSKKLTIELALRIRKPAKFTIDRVGKLFDMSTVSDKKKLKVLKKLTRTDKKFADYIGAALTISKSVTDFVGMAYDVVMPKKETKKGKMTKKIMKRRMPYLRAYATAFKKRRMYNTILTDNFYKQNKKLIKKLIDEDLGFKKAFKILKSKKPHVAKTSKSSKGSVDIKAIEKQAMKQKPARKPVPKSMELTKFLDEVKGMDGVA